jgi:hypothetical protein
MLGGVFIIRLPSGRGVVSVKSVNSGPAPMTKAEDQARDELRTADELASLVCKLRWLGMDHEADVLADHLAQHHKGDPPAVVTQICDTD